MKIYRGGVVVFPTDENVLNGEEGLEKYKKKFSNLWGTIKNRVLKYRKLEHIRKLFNDNNGDQFYAYSVGHAFFLTFAYSFEKSQHPMSQAFEEKIRQDLRGYLLLKNEIDVQFPQAIDIEEKWLPIAQSYIPDGAREFRNYPSASLAWMMYIGMAVAQYWEDDWEVYGHLEDIYLYLRDKEGYDTMDEYIRRTVLRLKEPAYSATETLVQECAERTYSALCRENIEPGTQEAFAAYVSCLHQLYLSGMAVQLKRLGYRMVKS